MNIEIKVYIINKEIVICVDNKEIEIAKLTEYIESNGKKKGLFKKDDNKNVTVCRGNKNYLFFTCTVEFNKDGSNNCTGADYILVITFNDKILNIEEKKIKLQKVPDKIVKYNICYIEVTKKINVLCDDIMIEILDVLSDLLNDNSNIESKNNIILLKKSIKVSSNTEVEFDKLLKNNEDSNISSNTEVEFDELSKKYEKSIEKPKKDFVN